MLLHDARRDARRTKPAIWWCWKSRIVAVGTASDRRSAAVGGAGAGGRTRSVRRAGGDFGDTLPGRARRRIRTGRGSYACTTYWNGCNPRRSFRSIGRWRWPWQAIQWARWSHRSAFFAQRRWRAITCCMPRAPICCGAWDRGRKRPKATGARWNWRPMRASAGFWSGAFVRWKRGTDSLP